MDFEQWFAMEYEIEEGLTYKEIYERAEQEAYNRAEGEDREEMSLEEWIDAHFQNILDEWGDCLNKTA